MSAALTWGVMWAMYEKALAAERAFDRERVDPLVPDDLPIGPERTDAIMRIPADIWSESERLADIRNNIEDDLLAMPSPTWAAFGQKVIICRADGRDLNGLDDMLVADANRLLAADEARAPDPLLSFLRTRNQVMREANDRSPMPEEEMNEYLDRAIALEKSLMATPASSIEGFTAKLMLQIEVAIEGFEVNEEFARALIREGRDAFGIGDFINPALEGVTP